MARALTPQDAYAIMNELVKQATGQQDIQVVDTSSFVSAGETVLATGVENTISSLYMLMGNIYVAVRPYRGKMWLVNAINTGAYTHRLMKISYYARENQEAGPWNTDLNDNLVDGRDNGAYAAASPLKKSVGNMWEQNQPKAAVLNFAGSDVWDTSTTVYEDQLKMAFRDPNEFNRFWNGAMMEKENDIESTREAFNRLTVLNTIGGIYANRATYPDRAVNLTAAFNAEFGTNYTSQELRTTHLDAFLKFFVPLIKLTSDRMEERSVHYHQQPANAPQGSVLMRHTPKADQRLMLYSPLIVKSEAYVMPEIFNDEYLKIDNFERVTYWQNNYDEEARPAVNIKPALPGTTQSAAEEASVIPYVVGLMFDRDALMTDIQLERVETTPIEARKLYRNIWWHFSKNAINDFTENAILFYMEDEETGGDGGDGGDDTP